MWLIAEDIPVAHTDAATFRNDDAACFQWLQCCLDGVRAGFDAEVGPRGAQGVDHRVGPRFELPAGDRGKHRVATTAVGRTL